MLSSNNKPSKITFIQKKFIVACFPCPIVDQFCTLYSQLCSPQTSKKSNSLCCWFHDQRLRNPATTARVGIKSQNSALSISQNLPLISGNIISSTPRANISGLQSLPMVVLKFKNVRLTDDGEMGQKGTSCRLALQVHFKKCQILDGYGIKAENLRKY